MKNIWLQLLTIFISLVVVGTLLQDPQQKLFEEMEERKLIAQNISHDDQMEIGQTGAAIALGGLRSLVAAVVNLTAFTDYTKEDWIGVEKNYNLAVTLQPNNIYYWGNAGWHMAYNAYHDYEFKLGLSPSRRSAKQKLYLQKGEEFFLSGAKKNPDSASLWRELGRLFTSSYKPFDFPKAAAYFKRAMECSNSIERDKRAYFYALARVPGAEKEAYEYGKKLISNGHDAITLRLIKEVFKGDKYIAYADMVNYYLRANGQQFPVGDLALMIQRLSYELKVPDRFNPLITPNMKPIPNLNGVIEGER